MRESLRCAALTAALALIVVVVDASAADADPTQVPGRLATPGTSAPTVGTCYAQTADGVHGGAVSQNFEFELDEYDSRGVVDFKLAHPCTIRRVLVLGSYVNGALAARSESVTFYRDTRGRPGGIFSDQRKLHGLDANGVFTITLATPISVRTSRYWVSVQADLDFDGGGEWFWDTRLTQVGLESRWQNPGDGFETSCVTYQPITECLGPVGPDFRFELQSGR